MKLKSALAVTATAMMAAGSAHAAGIFTVTPTDVSASYTNQLGTFDSDYIAGNYSEVITLTPTSATGGTFAYSILWTGSEFMLGGSSVVAPGFGTAPSTGLSNTYTLYATIYGTGSYSVNGTTVEFNPDVGGALNLYSDQGGITWTAPTAGGDPWTFGFIEDQRLLLTGTVTAASGELKQASGTGTDFGSFGVVTTVSLVDPDGEAFFDAPRPFFNVAFQSGNFNSYWLEEIPTVDPLTTNLGGGAQITFDSMQVPEPSSVALAGLGLLALAATVRRRRRS